MPKTESKDDTIRFRAARWEVEMSERAARAAGVSKSEFCRDAVREAARRSLTDGREKAE